MSKDVLRAAVAPMDFELLTRCMAGVLICRGFPEDEALAYAETIRRERPDKPVADLAREVGSVFLTLQAHGKMPSNL